MWGTYMCACVCVKQSLQKDNVMLESQHDKHVHTDIGLLSTVCKDIPTSPLISKKNIFRLVSKEGEWIQD